ncbi:MAG: RNA polymerase sigma factor RpoD/SigA [Chitinophagales bacterium]
MRHLSITKSITVRESESLEKYLREISKIELLSPGEEERLFFLVKKGDQKAVEQLVKANLRFVVSVAKQYQGLGLLLSDLIDEGNIGLIRAVKKFDSSRGFKFISFAVWWIRQNIIQALAANSRMIRLPLNKVALSSRIRKVSSLLEQKLERLPSEEELAEYMNIDPAEISLSLLSDNSMASLDTTVTDDDDENNLLDVLENTNAEKADKELSHTESLKVEMDSLLQTLSDRQKETVCLFFGIGIDHPLSLDEIAKQFDVTTERVRQIKEKAINKLRSTVDFNLLRTFLAA